MKVTIHAQGFAGGKGTLIEEGPEKSRIELELFGAKTVVELSNDAFTKDDDPPDVFSKYHKMIASDCRWAANGGTQDWWLAQEHIDAETWEAHLARMKAVEVKIAEDAETLLEALKSAVGPEAADAELRSHFQSNKATYQPFLSAWEERERADGAAQQAEEKMRAEEVERRKSVALEAWQRSRRASH